MTERVIRVENTGAEKRPKDGLNHSESMVSSLGLEPRTHALVLDGSD